MGLGRGRCLLMDMPYKHFLFNISYIIAPIPTHIRGICMGRGLHIPPQEFSQNPILKQINIFIYIIVDLVFCCKFAL